MIDQLARRVSISIQFEEQDVTVDIAPLLTEFTYNDRSDGSPDDIQIQLSDREGRFTIGDWRVSKGTHIRASLVAEHWISPGDMYILPCGLFTADQIEFNDPNLVTIKALSTPEQGAMRATIEYKAWEKTSLRTIAWEIAERAGLALAFECTKDPRYDRVEQNQRTDLGFLEDLCGRVGVRVKTTDGQLVLFDQAAYEQRNTVFAIVRGSANILRQKLTSTLSGVYDSASATAHDPLTGTTISETFAPESAPGSGRVLHTVMPVEAEEGISPDAVRETAKRALRGQNTGEHTASFDLIGDVRCVAGVTVRVEGYGDEHDGTYLVDEVSHKVSGNGGYTISPKMHRALEGY